MSAMTVMTTARTMYIPVTKVLVGSKQRGIVKNIVLILVAQLRFVRTPFSTSSSLGVGLGVREISRAISSMGLTPVGSWLDPGGYGIPASDSGLSFAYAGCGMATTVDSDIEEADGNGNDVFPAFFRPNFMDRGRETAVRMRSQLRMAWHGMRLTLHSRRRADGRSMAVLMIRRRAKKRAEVLFHFVRS